MMLLGFRVGEASRTAIGFLLLFCLLASCGEATSYLDWQKCLGGSRSDYAQSIQQTADGGYIVAGDTNSNNGNMSGNNGQWDYWIVKLDQSGNLIWQRCLGGSQDEYAQSVQQTADGGYAVAGFTNSNDGDVRGNHGYYDYWVVKLGEINCTITSPDVVSSGSTGNVASTAESGAAYAWSITNGAITSASNAQSITFSAGASGTTRLTANVIKKGSWDKCYKDIAISLADCSWSSSSPVSNGTAVQFTGPAGMDSYRWEFGDGVVSLAKDPDHLYSAPKTYAVSLTMTKSGCSKSCAGQVEVRGPDCRWTSNAPVCNGTPVQFMGPAGKDSYFWELGDGAVSSAQSPAHLYAASGTYLVSFWAGKGGCIKICTKTVEVKGPDCRWTSNAPVCNGTPVQFTGPSGMGAYEWKFGDGNTSSDQDPKHLYYLSPGTYAVNLTVAKDDCSNKCSKDITVTAGPDCSWTSNAPVCEGTPVQFTGPGGMDAYQWEFGDGSTSSNKDQSHLYLSPGTYAVNLTVAKGSCIKSCTGTVVVHAINYIEWQKCLGGSGYDNSRRVQQTADGGYVVAGLAASNDGDVSSNHGGFDFWVVKLDPSGNLVWQKCLGGTNADSASGIQQTTDGGYVVVGYTYSNNGNVSGKHGDWDWWIARLDPSGNPVWGKCLGGSNEDFAQSVQQTADDEYIIAGYTHSEDGDVKGNHGGSDYWIVQLDGINAPDVVCSGSTGNVASVALSGASYAWYITNGEITSASNAQSITFTAGISGTVSLRVIMGKDDHWDNGYKDIAINLPDCSWTSKAPVCDGTPVQFTGPSGMDSYNWDFGDGAVSSEKDPSHLYAATRNYTVNLTVTKAGCSRTSSGSVFFRPMPDCSWTPNAPVCDGTIVQFNGPAGMDNYQWDFGDGQVSSREDSMHLYRGPGTYAAKLTVTQCGIVKSCPGTIKVKPQANCSWSSNAPTCNGTPVQFKGPAGMEAYRWEFGDGKISLLKDPSHLYPAPGNYSVSLWTKKEGCTKICKGSVVVAAPPDCSWTSNSPVCYGTPVQFTGPSGMDSCQWDFGDGQVSSAQNPAHLYSAPGTYTVDLTAANDGCSNTCTKKVDILSRPDCRWTSSSPVCNGTPINFTGPSGVDSYFWDFGDGQNSSAQNPVHLYSAPAIYTVNLKAAKDGGTKSCAGKVEVMGRGCSWSSNSPVCNGTAVRFTGPTGMDSYLWEFGDGAVSSDKDPSHLYRAPGTYTVNLTAVKGSCIKKCTKNVEVRTPAACGRAICIEWQRCLGGSQDEYAQSVQQTADGGYIAAGYTQSNDGDVSGNHSAKDFWVVKLDPSGNKTWQKCLGGSGNDEAYSVRQTAEGGYVVAGATASNDYDVGGNHGAKDFWVVKLNESGNLIWQKCLGGSGDDDASSVRQTADEGYVVAGYTKSNDGNVSGNHGGEDFWIVKLDNLGKLVWQKCLGGKLGEQGMHGEQAWSIQQTADGGYVVAGHATSPDGDVGGTHGKLNYSDYWVVKLDASGNKTWQKCLGGRYIDEARSIQQTADGGYVVAGYGYSDDGDATGNHGNTKDYWVVKLNRSGNLEWQKSLGGFKNEEAHSVSQTADGGYVVVGYTESNDGDVSGKNNARDLWAVKLDLSGNLVWQKCLGGSGTDEARSILTIDGGYLVAGATASNDNDVSGNHGGLDVWVVKLREIDCTITAPDVVCSGSTGNSASIAESGAAYSWSITNGEVTSASNAQSINFTAGSQGTATLRVIVIGDGCSKDCSKEISILSRPDCSWTSNAPVCNGTPVQFSCLSGRDSYQWEFGDGAVSSSKDPAHIYSAPGSYPVNLTVTKDGCSKTCKGSVTIKPMPDCSWTSNSPVCNGTPVQFTGPAGMDSYNWDFGDGAASSAQGASHLYSAPGNYTVSLNATKDSCSKTCTGSVVVKVPDCSWTSSSPVCNGTAVVFDGPSGMDSYQWDFGDGSESREEDPVYLYSAHGTYTVMLAVKAGNINKSCPGSVVVRSQTDCGRTSNTPAPDGTAAQLSAPMGTDSSRGELGGVQANSRENSVRIYPG